jgi:hypothetical protein
VGIVRFYAVPRCHTLPSVSEHLSFAFSDSAEGLHCHGSGGLALVLGAGTTTVVAAPIDGEQESGRFAIEIAGVCRAELEALGPPIVHGGGERRDWICRLGGTSAAGASLTGYGCVTAGAPVHGRVTLRRHIWICFADDLAFTLTAERRRAKDSHGDERVTAFVARGEPLAALQVADPRLSSTYGTDGRVLRAGLELWEDDDEDGDGAVVRDRGGAFRIAGETVAAGEFAQHPELKTSVAFLVWHHNGREGVGSYAIDRMAG